jgi:hypothetical protein
VLQTPFAFTESNDMSDNRHYRTSSGSDSVKRKWCSEYLCSYGTETPYLELTANVGIVLRVRGRAADSDVSQAE